MAKVIRGFAEQGIVACFTEPNLSGDPLDFDAPRNAPAKFPNLWLANITFHSDFLQYEMIVPVQTVTIVHAAVPIRARHLGAGGSTGGGFFGSSPPVGATVVGNTVAANHTLYTHSLGFGPKAFVVYNNRMLSAGTLIQVDPYGGRAVSPYVTNSIVGIKSISASGSAPLPSVSRTYKVLVFRDNSKTLSKPLFQKDGSRLTLGRGMIDTDKRYLRKTLPADQSFSLDLGPTVSLGNGRARNVTGGQTLTEGGYVGSFAGSPYIPVGVP